jgi:uncharacterized delta-60 repeat protein
LVIVNSRSDEYFNDFVILADGRFLVAGFKYDSSGRQDFAVYRYLANGTRDTGFGTNGVITTPVGSGAQGTRIVLQPDGKFVAAGFTFSNNAVDKVAVVRYNADGTLDTAFGTNGIAQPSVGNNILNVREVLVQTDGRLLVAGQANFGGNINIFVLRYNSNGTLDNSFGASGIVQTDIDNQLNVVGGMALQADGKIVVNSVNLNSSGSALLSSSIVRYNTDGTLDNTFGTGGIVRMTEPSQNSAGIAIALAIQQNGKILTAGMRNGTYAVARYNPNGTIDTSFGTNGIVTTTLGNNPGFDRIFSIALQSDGKIVAAGGVNDANFFFEVGLVRYLGDAVSAAPRAVPYDFFGTGRSNYLSLNFQGTQFRWDILRNPVTNPLQTRRTFWGLAATDYPMFGDYDGDLKIDVGVWRPGTAANPQSYFYIQRSSSQNPNEIYGQPWGIATDSPIQGDFDGDGKDDFAVSRIEGANLSMYILPSGGGGYRRIVFGRANDIALNGADFNGDGKDDVVVFRQSDANGNLVFYAADAETGSLIFAQQWGNTRVAPFTFGIGDYTGDERADIYVFYGDCRQTNPNCGVAGTWWIKETGSANYTVTKFDIPPNFETGEGDFPVDGDFDGDGKFDITVLRQTTSTFYHLLSSNGQFAAQFWDGNSAVSPSSATNLFESAIEPRGKSIPASAFKAMMVTKQPDGTVKIERASDFYFKR